MRHYEGSSLSHRRACDHPRKVRRVRGEGQLGRMNFAAVHLISALIPCCGVKVQRSR